MQYLLSKIWDWFKSIIQTLHAQQSFYHNNRCAPGHPFTNLSYSLIMIEYSLALPGSHILIQFIVLYFNQLLISIEKFLPLPGFEPGTSPVPSRYATN